MFRLTAHDISQRFGQNRLFSKLNLDLETGDSLTIAGANGSGKSTLLQILVRLIRPTEGRVKYVRDGAELDDHQWQRRVGFVSPYMNLYDKLSGEENLKFYAGVCGDNLTGKRIDELLELVGLSGRGHDLAGEYSSGMKQRLKYAVALRSDPAWLFLDEPSANLDDSGKTIVADVIDSLRDRSIIVIATNETEEYRLAQQQIRLG